MKLSLIGLTVIMGFALSGCVAAWGKSYNVVAASPTAITIEYDVNLTDLNNVQNVALAHCSQFEKKASLLASARKYLGGIESVQFECR